jgi:hypothetical protein
MLREGIIYDRTKKLTWLFVGRARLTTIAGAVAGGLHPPGGVLTVQSWSARRTPSFTDPSERTD